jgi:putative peptidoglycan lipid II flippase
VIRTLLLALLASTTILVALGSQWALLALFGASRATDALVGSLAVPQFLLGLASGPLASVLVPLFASSTLEERSRDAAILLRRLFVAGTAAALLLAVAAPWWVPILAGGLSGADLELAIALHRVQIWSIAFIGPYAVLGASSQAEERFLRIELSLVISNALALGLLLVLGRAFGVQGAAWALLARSVLQTVALLPFDRRPISAATETPRLKETWVRLRPLLAASAYYKSDVLVDRFLASYAAPGGLALYYLAQQLHLTAMAIVSKALVGPRIPRLAILATAAEWDAFRRAIARGVLETSLLLLAGLVVLVGGGEALLGLLVGHGGITQANVHLLWLLMIGMSGVMIGAPGQFLASAFYALGDTVSPTKSSIAAYTLGLGFKVAGFLSGGLVGFALGTTAYYLTSLLFLGLLLRRKLRALGGARGL